MLHIKYLKLLAVPIAIHKGEATPQMEKSVTLSPSSN
jgi:hypothetical protein